MAERRFIFFDVGNTLLFPNRSKMLASLAIDRHPTLEQWQSLERRTKKEFDLGIQNGGVDHGFWWTFHTYLLQQLGEENGIRDVLVENTQNSANWDQVPPGTRDCLDRLRKEFRIAVISNADGGIERVLRRCGIVDCFESITDSGIVGVEKPRAEIFEAALAAMKATPDDSLYVGDMYSVDYLGARNVGMQAVLLDVAGAYRDRDVPRVESLEQLESWLQR
ncbi:MAG: HAD-superfamily hydrolase, subfamily variant 1 [Candidatus Sulfotelmatobacter sp.]|nr:HAD-superfamily hydrolase, subfamily variant 1 [Candidatus Sulfotelmatobacter sp.]